MKPRFNIDFNLGCGWHPGSKFQILAVSLFDKIGDEIFCTFQVATFVFSLSITLYEETRAGAFNSFPRLRLPYKDTMKTLLFITLL